MKIDVIVIIDSRLERLWQFCKCVKRETLVKFAVTAYHIFWHVDISKVKEKLANTRIELYIENESFFVSRINEKRILFHSTRLISSSFFFFSNETFFFLFLNRSKKIHDKIQIDEIFFFQFRRHPRIKRTRKRVGDRCKSIQVHSSSTTVWISLTRWMWRLLAKVSTNLRQVVRQSRYVIDSRVINGWICCVGSIARSSN